MLKRNIMLIVLLVLSLWALDAQAAFVKKLRIESIPSGAAAYLLQGMKRVHLGATPLEYEAEFHSEISILRMLFKKRACKDLILEVSASQDKVVANLELLAIAAEPGIHKDLNLRKIQQQLNPIINRSVPKMLEEEKRLDINLAGPIRVAGKEEKVFLVVPIIIEHLKGEIKGTGKARHEMLLKTLWNQLGGSIAIPLAKEIRDQRGITGILLEAKFDEIRYIFSAEPTIGTKMEMECVPGYRTQMVMKYRQVPYSTYDYFSKSMVTSYRTESYLDTQQVFDPCANRRLTAKPDVKIDPKASTFKDQAVAQFLLPLEIIDKNLASEKLYEEIGILLTDSKGKQLERQGPIEIPALQ